MFGCPQAWIVVSLTYENKRMSLNFLFANSLSLRTIYGQLLILLMLLPKSLNCEMDLNFHITALPTFVNEFQKFSPPT